MKPLGDFQRYLIEEFVEDWRAGEMSRREMVRRAVYITGGSASAATVLVSLGCGPTATPTTAARPTSPPPAATQVVQPTATGATAPAASTPAPTNTAAPGSTPSGAVPPAGSTVTAQGAATKPAGAASTPGTPAAAAKPAAPSGPRSPRSVPEGDPAVSARKVEFPGEAGTVFGYLASPAQAGSYPGLIVIHENRGLVPHIQDVARRAAKEGYVALAVDLLSRAGGTEKVTDPAQISGALGQAKPEELVSDLSSGVKFLQAQSSVSKDKIGVFGFCFGGGYTWRLAVANKEIKAAVPFYGPAPPLEQIPNTSAAVLAIYGENDARINQGIPQLEEALKKAGKTYEIKIYPGVGHAFHNDTGANWNEAAALDAWNQTMAWFKKHLA